MKNIKYRMFYRGNPLEVLSEFETPLDFAYKLVCPPDFAIIKKYEHTLFNGEGIMDISYVNNEVTGTVDISFWFTKDVS